MRSFSYLDDKGHLVAVSSKQRGCTNVWANDLHSSKPSRFTSFKRADAFLVGLGYQRGAQAQKRWGDA